MSGFAYRSRERIKENIVFAIDCTERDKGIRFFCPNPDCDAYMYLCNLNNNGTKPYFRATLKNHKHIPDCFYEVINFMPEDYNESKFDFEKATYRVMRLRRESKAPEKKKVNKSDKLLPPHTIKQIYNMAKSLPPDDTYNGTSIWRILADERSRNYYKLGIFNCCMVEGKFAGYVLKKLYIRIKYYIGNDTYHYLRLYFNDENIYHDILREILTFYKNSPIVVWGKWFNRGNNFISDILSKSQLYTK